MPEVKRIELPEWATVDRQLHDAVIDLLPADMAEDSLVRWVTEFDDLTSKSRQDGGTFESFEREWYADGGKAWIICNLASSALQARLPFYFAALFHIGRMRQVSQFVLENIAKKQKADGFKEWALSVAERLTGPDSDARATEVLQKLSVASKEFHSHQLATANRWWGSWKREVEPLRRNVAVVYETWGQTHRRETLQTFMEFWATINSPSELLTSMSREGVRFKSVQTPTSFGGTEQFSSQSWWLPLILVGMGDRQGHAEGFGDELRYLLHDWLRAEELRSMAPQAQIALDRLRMNYGEKNPFDEFGVGRHAATVGLRKLIKENTLPNWQPSPWLHAWKQTLEIMPWVSDQLPKPTEQEESLRSALHLADSAIKGNITNKMLPTETWNDFVQRIFEDNWVKTVGLMAGETNRKATAAVWSLDEFADFIEKVVLRLNDIGYTLRPPATPRLQALLDKTSRGESVSGDHSW